MTGGAPVLLAAAAGVGVAHAILPDHWMPLATLGRTRRWSLARVARLSALAGLGHVLLSVVLGAILVTVGLQFRHAVETAQAVIIGGLLIATGVGFLVLQVRGHGHHHHGHHHHGHGHDDGHDHHHDHGHQHDDDHHRHDDHPHPPGRLALLIPFGAAASPDLTILPVFLAATTVGAATAVGSLLVFAAVTIATFVVLTVAATAGGYRLDAAWLEHSANAVTGGVLLVIGALVCVGVL